MGGCIPARRIVIAEESDLLLRENALTVDLVSMVEEQDRWEFCVLGFFFNLSFLPSLHDTPFLTFVL